jgi:hypothetical protein
MNSIPLPVEYAIKPIDNKGIPEHPQFVEDIIMFVAGTDSESINDAMDAKHDEGTDNQAVMCLFSDASRYFATFTMDEQDDFCSWDFICLDWGEIFCQLIVADENLPKPGDGGWSYEDVRRFVYHAGLKLREAYGDRFEVEYINIILDRMKGVKPCPALPNK